MGKSKHTPGPWTAYGSVIRSDSGRFVCKADYYPIEGESLEGRRDTIEANARLIAAAPELLEACKSMSELIRLAIEKAEGAK